MGKIVISVAFDEETAKSLEEVSKSLGISKNDFIRMAVREKLARMSFLDEETKKAFGIKIKEGEDYGGAGAKSSSR